MRLDYIDDEAKLLAVIESCATEEHYRAALEMVELFIAKHETGEGYRQFILNRIKSIRGE